MDNFEIRDEIDNYIDECISNPNWTGNQEDKNKLGDNLINLIQRIRNNITLPKSEQE